MRGESSKWTANNSMIAGAGGGLVASVATCPLDVVKTKLQAQRVHHSDKAYLGVLGTLRQIMYTDGLRGLYRGLGPTMLGYLPTWAIYFAVYDGIKTYFGEEPLGSTSTSSSTAATATKYRYPSRREGSGREEQGPQQQQQQQQQQQNNLSQSPGHGKEKLHLYPAAQVKGYQPLVREHPWGLHILSAMTAGAASTMVTNPLWVIKTRFMTQPPNEGRYRHTLDAFLTIYRTEGVSAFYRGLFPSLLGIAHVAVQFPLYEKLKIWAQGKSPEPLTSGQILACSGVAKMCASLATYPHEVVRTRLQTTRRLLAAAEPPSGSPIQSGVAGRIHVNGIVDGGVGGGNGNGVSGNFGEVERVQAQEKQPQKWRGSGLVYTTKKILRKEGWRGLYKGLSVNLIRTVPNSAVTMLTYELLMRQLSAREE